MPLSRDELLDQSDNVLSALTPVSSSAVGPNSQRLQNSLLSESRGEEACGEGVNMAGIKRGIQLLFPTFQALNRKYDMIDSFLGRGRKTSLS